jgi:hypothetical protein
VSASAYAPHGPILYAGACNGRKGIWIDATLNRPTTVTINTNNCQNGTFRAMRLNGNDWVLTQPGTLIPGKYEVVIATAAGASQLTIDVAGYYSFELDEPLLSTSTTALVNSLVFSGSCCVLAHSPIFGYQGLAQNVIRGRILTASVLYTFRGSTLQNDGMVTAFQFPPGASFSDIKLFSDIESCPQSYRGRWEKGLYTFLKLNSPKNVEYQDAAFVTGNGANGVITDYTYDLCDSNGFLAIAVDVGASIIGGTSQPAAIGDLRVGHSIEWITGNPFFGLAVPCYSAASFTLAFEMMSHVIQFHENGLHLKDIAEFFKKALGYAERYGPTAMNIMRLVSRAL